MFERFTRGAREVVVHAQQVDVATGQRRIDVPHLLWALIEVPDQMAGEMLRDAGLDGTWLRDGMSRTADAAVLDALGIDLAAVRSHVEGAFGDGALSRSSRPRGHRPFTRAAKEVLTLSLREAMDRQDRSIGTEHMLLAILRAHGETAGLLRSAGIDRAFVENQIERRRTAA